MKIFCLKSKCFFAVALALVLLFSGCGVSGVKTQSSDTQTVYTEEEIFQKIEELIETQEAAIINADSEAIEATVNPADAWLITEWSHLVSSLANYPVEEYLREVTDLYMQGNYYIGTVTQSFIYEGEERTGSELRYFMFEDGSAYDMGTYLEKAMWDNVFVAFPSSEYDFAESLAEAVNAYIPALSSVWALDFTDAISIKIYEDKKTFLYNTKLTMPEWAGGWYERGESIKTYIYDTTQENYEYMVRHEATHILLTEATNDNAAYWMQEGFATTMPEYITYGNLTINRLDVLMEAYSQDVVPTVYEHVNTNIETLSDIFYVRLYYAYSSAMAVYLLENTTTEQLVALFEELRTYPYISLTMSQRTISTQEITEKCFKKALGVSFYDFYSSFDVWLAAEVA